MGDTIHSNVKCDCGHTQKDHYQGTGWCHHSGHENPGKCGCTWYHPNEKYLKKVKKNMEKQFVYVVWDTFSEKVLCVHKDEDTTCEVCERIIFKEVVPNSLASFYPVKREKFEVK